MKILTYGLGILLLTAAAISGEAAEPAAPVVDVPDSVVFRDPFVDANGIVTNEFVAAPIRIAFREPFLDGEGTVLRESVVAPVNAVFRDRFIDADGVVTRPDVTAPDGLVFREPFVNAEGTVLEMYIEAPDGLVFRNPFVDSDGTVRSILPSAVPGWPSSQLVTVRGIYPNPFNPSVQISFYLSERTEVEVVVLDLAGRVVRRLFRGPLPADLHVLKWDGKMDSGKQAATGQYLFRIDADGEVVSAKAMLIK